MNDPLLIGISYCGTHNKGDEATSSDAIRVTPEEHAEWLLASVKFYQRLGVSLERPVRVIVTAVGLPSLMAIDIDERNVMWEVSRLATVLSVPENPGHQVGACVALKEGLDAANHWGYPRYFHVTEDVLPWPGVVGKFVDLLDDNDYVGMRWPSGVLNLHMIACRSKAFWAFHPAAVRKYQGIEHYFEALLKDRPIKVNATGEGCYITTHDWQQYQSWLKKMPDETNPIVKRVASDNNWRHFG